MTRTMKLTVEFAVEDSVDDFFVAHWLLELLTDRVEDKPYLNCGGVEPETVPEDQPFDPRNNAEDAFQAFIKMPSTEWSGLIGSLLRGGVLTPAEQEGFERALKVRFPVVG